MNNDIKNDNINIEDNLYNNKDILHCDMNNFFASVECAIDPTLNDAPIAVCGDVEERHGIVMACNYLAKKFNVKAAEPIWQAKLKCPNLVIVKEPHYNEYQKYSKLARDIYLSFTDRVEPMGIDECFLDVTNSKKLFGEPIVIAEKIKNRIKSELNLTISIGVSFNKVFAKFGSDYKKPNAITIISKDNFKNIVWPEPIDSLIGVGSSTKNILNKYYIKTIGDLAHEKVDVLSRLLGKNGIYLYNAANGYDKTEVKIYEEIEEQKSIGHGITTKYDIKNYDEAWKILLSLSQEISYKLRIKKLRAKVVHITIRDYKLSTKDFQKKLDFSIQSSIDITKVAFELLKEKYNIKIPIRTLTISVSKLINDDAPEEINIFHDIVKQQKQEKVEECIDELNEKYGTEKIKNASLLTLNSMPETRRKINYNRKINYDKKK